jgi:hypothetical protein
MRETDGTCTNCGQPADQFLCPACSQQPYPDYRVLRSPDGKHILNARSYVRDHDKLEQGRTYTLEELQRDFGMPRLSRLGFEPRVLQYIVERLP